MPVMANLGCQLHTSEKKEPQWTMASNQSGRWASPWCIILIANCGGGTSEQVVPGQIRKVS